MFQKIGDVENLRFFASVGKSFLFLWERIFFVFLLLWKDFFLLFNGVYKTRIKKYKNKKIQKADIGKSLAATNFQ